MNTIAIDCGASFIKSALFSENGEILKQKNVSTPEVGCDIFNETKQIDSLMECLNDIIIEFSQDENEYNLCISNEMHGFILANDLGEPVIDYVSWQKEFGNLKIDDLTPLDIMKQRIDDEDLLYTGMPLRNGLPNSNLIYVLNRISSKGRLFFYTLGDYIIRKLSGFEPNCHPTNAAATGLYDLRTNNWNSKIIEVCANENIIFPVICEDVILFEVNNKTYHVYPALGDQQAALLGSGLDSTDCISFNLGTGAQVSMLTKEIKRNNNYQIRPFFAGYNLKTIPHIPSGRALNVFIRFIKDILNKFNVEIADGEIWNVILKNFIIPERLEMKCDLSFFENSITSNNKGALLNIGEYDLTLNNLFCAAFLQMVDNYCDMAIMVNNEKKEIKRIIFSGGISRKINPIIKEIVRKFNCSSDYSVMENETLIGLYRYPYIGLRGDI